MNSNTVRRRIEMLEGRIGGEAVTLVMGDGSQRQISSTLKHFCKLRDAGLLDDEASPNLASEVAWLRGAIKIEEPGDGGLFHLLQTLLLTPNTEGQEDDPDEDSERTS